MERLIRVTVEKEMKYTRTVTGQIGEGQDVDDAKDAAIDYARAGVAVCVQTEVF